MPEKNKKIKRFFEKISENSNWTNQDKVEALIGIILLERSDEKVSEDNLFKEISGILPVKKECFLQALNKACSNKDIRCFSEDNAIYYELSDEIKELAKERWEII